MTLSRMSEKLNFSIRLDAELKTEVERVARLGGVSPSDVIRVCVTKGLPLLAEGYQLIHERFAELQARPLAAPPRVSSAAASAGGEVAAALLRQAAAAVPESEPKPRAAVPSGGTASPKPAGARPASRPPSPRAPAPK